MISIYLYHIYTLSLCYLPFLGLLQWPYFFDSFHCFWVRWSKKRSFKEFFWLLGTPPSNQQDCTEYIHVTIVVYDQIFLKSMLDMFISPPPPQPQVALESLSAIAFFHAGTSAIQDLSFATFFLFPPVLNRFLLVPLAIPQSWPFKTNQTFIRYRCNVLWVTVVAWTARLRRAIRPTKSSSLSQLSWFGERTYLSCKINLSLISTPKWWK